MAAAAAGEPAAVAAGKVDGVGAALPLLTNLPDAKEDGRACARTTMRAVLAGLLAASAPCCCTFFLAGGTL
jgi:hypothetical protein